MTDDNNKNLNTESQTAAGTAADTSTGKMPAAGPNTDKQNKDLRFTETEDTTLEGALEALLFAMGDSVELSRLAAAVGRTSSQT